MTKKHRRRFLEILFMLAALVIAYGEAQKTQPPAMGKPDPVFAEVVDGDTLKIGENRIRLHGIDAPESRQKCRDEAGKPWPCGQQAKAALAARIGASPLFCHEKGRDSYARTLAVCFVEDIDLNRFMVENGWAVAYRAYSRDYAAAEGEAKSNRRGIWAGKFEMPRDWRKRQGIGSR